MADDYTAPLGINRDAPPRRSLPIWPFLAGPSVLIILALAIWAALRPDPYGGRPHVVVDIPPPPPPAAALPAPAAAPAQPDDPSGQIIIRDPYGGRPHVVVDIPPPPPPAAALPAPAAAPAQPDDPSGQIIIRDP